MYVVYGLDSSNTSPFEPAFEVDVGPGRVIFFRGTHIVWNNFGSIFNYIF